MSAAAKMKMNARKAAANFRRCCTYCWDCILGINRETEGGVSLIEEGWWHSLRKGAMFHFWNRFSEGFYQCSWAEFFLFSPTATEVSVLLQLGVYWQKYNGSPLKNLTRNYLLKYDSRIMESKEFSWHNSEQWILLVGIHGKVCNYGHLCDSWQFLETTSVL